MPLVNPSPDSPPEEKPTEVRIAKPLYRGVTVDTNYIPRSALLSNIEGSSWTVDYYSQVLDDDSAVNGQMVNREAGYQQYRLIKGMELKVTSPINQQTQDHPTKSMNVQGGANVYPFLIPNVGDMFLADIGDGREGVFQVTNSERRSILKDTAYFVEYVLVDYSTQERLDDFRRKTILRLQFVREFLMYNQNPLVVEEVYQQLTELKGRYNEILTYYLKTFTSNEFKTLIIPGQEYPIYDHFFMKFVKKFITSWDSYMITQNRILNCDGDDTMNGLTVLDAIIDQNARIMNDINERAGLMSTTYFTREAMMEGVYYSGVRFVVYPIDPILSTDFERRKVVNVVGLEKLVDVPARPGRLRDKLPTVALDGFALDATPLIHKVTVDDFYIFSQAFYDRTEEGQSKLEILVQYYLQKKMLNTYTLLDFCESFHAWGALEKFYYLPIVLILIKATIRGV